LQCKPNDAWIKTPYIAIKVEHQQATTQTRNVMMHMRMDKSPLTLPVSLYAGGPYRQDDDGNSNLWTDRSSRALCDSSCPQFMDRKKLGRCTLQAIDVTPGEQCLMLKRFLPGVECQIED
jgi:hypothetical protein